MKNVLRPALSEFGLTILRKVIVSASFCASIGCGLLLIGTQEKYKFKAAGPIGVTVMILGCFISLVSVPQTFDRMKADKALLLSDAVVHTFYSHLLWASFLPLIGPLFGRLLEHKKTKNPFTQDDAK